MGPARECPKCRLVNPATADQCDCGYEFGTGRVSSPPVRRQHPLPVVWLLVPVGLMVGAVLGGPLYLAAVRPPGLAGLYYLLTGAVYGAVLGTTAGIVAAVALHVRRST